VLQRAVRHLLRDAGRSDPVLPLQGIYELLSAATTESQSEAIEKTLIDTSPITEHTLWRIADSLQLPITRELHYYGSEPDFTLAVGDVGCVEPAPLVENLNGANARISIESWRNATPVAEYEDGKPRKNLTTWQKHLSSRAMRLQVATPYFQDCDFPLSSDSTKNWLR
jgi:hypothetical protein